MTRPRLLILTQIYPRPGQPTLGTFIVERARTLAQHADVRIAAPVPYFPPLPRLGRYSQLAQIQDESVTSEGQRLYRPRYLVLPRVATWLQGPSMAWSVRRWSRNLTWRPQIIDSHFAFPDGFAAVALAQRLHCRCTLTCHGSDLTKYPSLPLVGPLLRRALEGADRVIAVSPELHDRAVWLGCPPQRAAVLPNGVDTELFRPRDKQSCRRELGLRGEGFLAVCVGRLDENKNQYLLLETLALLKAGGAPPVHLVLVGEGPLRSSLQQQAHRLGIAGQVTFAGSQLYERVPLWMAAADWLVLSSLCEGWPTVYHEAMSCGRPVITTPVAAAGHAVKEASLGLVVPQATPPAFAEAIVEAQKRQFDPQIIRAHACRHDWRQWASSYMEIVRELLDGSRSPQEVAA